MTFSGGNDLPGSHSDPQTEQATRTMSDPSDPFGKKPGKPGPISHLKLVRTEAPATGTPPISAETVRLSLEAPASRPPVFETIRIVEPARLRAALRRQAAALVRRDKPIEDMPEARRSLMATLDALHASPHWNWPEVVVIRRSEAREIQTNFAVVGEVIYLGAHLSPTWEEGTESLPFYAALNEALLVYARARQSRFEAVQGPK